jgi:hypothetical protein
VFDVVYLADYIEAHLALPGGVSVARLLGELDAIVSQDCVDTVGTASAGVLRISTLSTY